MIKFWKALIGAAVTIACVYLVRFEFSFSFPMGGGHYEYRFKYGK